MSTDNRTELNDCDAITGFTGDGPVDVDSTAGFYYEGTNAITTQHSNTDEHIYTTEDSLNGGTFSIDMSDATLYLIMKDNLIETDANGGAQFVIGDGTDTIGFGVGGNNSTGIQLDTFWNTYKLDVTERANAPYNNPYSGTTANLTVTAITQVGYGSVHLAKAQGNVDNIKLDNIRYIANGSYAFTINGGTVGTPETMADVVADNITNGWGCFANPLGLQYTFFAPTEFGDTGTASSYLTADDEQWVWDGGIVGATHFPFRFIGNATGTNSAVLNRVSITNVGTKAELLMSDTNMDTLKLDACIFSGLGTIALPSLSGTNRYTTNCIFIGCDQITHNGADASGSKVSAYEGTANTSAFLYNETVDPDGELDGMEFIMGTTSTHAIEFGTSVPASMTLRDCVFVGYGAGNNANDSTFHFKDTAGTITLNIVGGSGNVSYRTDGATIIIVQDPVTTSVHAITNTGADVASARVFLEASDGTGDLPYQDSVSITQSAGVATVTHTAHGLATNNYVVIRGATPEGYNKVAQITVTTANAYTYSVASGLASPATGSPVSSGVMVYGLTDVNGAISDTRTISTDQPVMGWCRKSTTQPFYKSSPLAGTVDSASGLPLTALMISDE